MPRGGARTGAGRPARYEGPKEQRSIMLSPRAWAFVAWIAEENKCNASRALEKIIRSHFRFVPEATEQAADNDE